MNLWHEANRAFYNSGVWMTVRTAENRQMLKYPTDLYVYEEIIRNTAPEVIVETGSFDGGSAAWFARFADVVSVDIHTPSYAIPKVTWVQGDSVECAREVRAIVGDRRALVSLDSDHNSGHVLKELDAYEQIATDYLVVEDTAVDEYGLDQGNYADGGPGRAVKAWLEEHPEWEPDRECERFMIGMNPGGWLRRR